jgi:hypothetical protein
VWLFVMVMLAISAKGLVAQSGEAAPPSVRHFEFSLSPFVSPLAGDLNTAQKAIGLRADWPAISRLGASIRYERRWDVSERTHGYGSIDLVWELNNTTVVSPSLGVTAGWARWNGRNYGTGGIRAVLAVLNGGKPTAAHLEFWIDIRSAFAGLRPATRLYGTVWTEFMVAVPITIRLGR